MEKGEIQLRGAIYNCATGNVDFLQTGAPDEASLSGLDWVVSGVGWCDLWWGGAFFFFRGFLWDVMFFEVYSGVSEYDFHLVCFCLTETVPEGVKTQPIFCIKNSDFAGGNG